jgi:hypothetical protein
VDVSDPHVLDLGRSLPGPGPLCSTWARSMCHVLDRSLPFDLAQFGYGASGYHDSAKKIITATRRIIDGIKNEIPVLYVLGNPPASVVAFAAMKRSGINILKVGDTMAKKGWHLSALQNPPAVHIAVTVRTVLPPYRGLFSFHPLSNVDSDGPSRGHFYR